MPWLWVPGDIQRGATSTTIRVNVSELGSTRTNKVQTVVISTTKDSEVEVLRQGFFRIVLDLCKTTKIVYDLLGQIDFLIPSSHLYTLPLTHISSPDLWTRRQKDNS